MMQPGIMRCLTGWPVLKPASFSHWSGNISTIIPDYIRIRSGRWWPIMHKLGQKWHEYPHIDINRGTNRVKDIVHIAIGK